MDHSNALHRVFASRLCHSGQTHRFWLLWEPSNIPRQFPEMAIKRNFTLLYLVHKLATRLQHGCTQTWFTWLSETLALGDTSLGHCLESNLVCKGSWVHLPSYTCEVKEELVMQKLQCLQFTVHPSISSFVTILTRFAILCDVFLSTHLCIDIVSWVCVVCCHGREL